MGKAAKRLHEKDNVAVLLEEVKEGEKYTVVDSLDGSSLGVMTATEEVKFGHKVALRNIAKGQGVFKYGEEIGQATKDVTRGQWVHLHNLASQRGYKD